MAGWGDENFRFEFRISGVFVAVIVERHIIGIGRKSLKKDIYPARTMDVVVFEKIDEGIGVEIKLFNVFEHSEKRTRFGPLFDLDGFVLNEMIPNFDHIEKIGNADAGVCGLEKIAMACLAAKTGRALFFCRD